MEVDFVSEQAFSNIPSLMIAYTTNLTWWSVLFAIVVPIISAVVSVFKGGIGNFQHADLSKLGFSILSKAAAAFSLPAAPALFFCALYPPLLQNVQNIELALIISAFGLLLVCIIELFRS